jgi:hypothetical protein
MLQTVRESFVMTFVVASLNSIEVVKDAEVDKLIGADPAGLFGRANTVALGVRLAVSPIARDVLIAPVPDAKTVPHVSESVTLR